MAPEKLYRQGGCWTIVVSYMKQWTVTRVMEQKLQPTSIKVGSVIHNFDNLINVPTSIEIDSKACLHANENNINWLHFSAFWDLLNSLSVCIGRCQDTYIDWNNARCLSVFSYTALHLGSRVLKTPQILIRYWTFHEPCQRLMKTIVRLKIGTRPKSQQTTGGFIDSQCQSNWMMASFPVYDTFSGRICISALMDRWRKHQ